MKYTKAYFIPVLYDNTGPEVFSGGILGEVGVCESAPLTTFKGFPWA